MCGIFCAISSSADTQTPAGLRDTLALLRRRGPDRTGEHRLQASDQQHLHFCGHVLWQQGNQPCTQPLVSERNGSVLLWNGDVYAERGDCRQSDTEWLLEELTDCQSAEQLSAFFRSAVRGPFGLIYYDAATRTLWVARDSLGRQSLLLGRLTDPDDAATIVVTSVATKSLIDSAADLIELPPLGLFALQMDSGTWSLLPWQDVRSQDLYSDQLAEVNQLLGQEIEVRSVAVQPEWLAVSVMSSRSDAPACWSFETVLNEMSDLEQQKPDDTFDLLLQNEAIAATADDLLALLDQSVRERCEATPDECRECLPLPAAGGEQCQHCRIGVLFSGGLDCTILAVLADRCVPAGCPIDLLNVSFERVRSDAKGGVIDYDTPDRLSARQSVLELRALRPERVWNLVEANIPRAELHAAIGEQIADLVHPLQTVLDESLGAALWFAARGVGQVTPPAGDGYSVLYTSPARVLLHGSGADELFGGYTRHRNAFTRSMAAASKTNNSGPVSSAVGWAALTAELELDWTRLPARNLARDDRCIADHGRTARAPYVQEAVAVFVRRLAAQQRCAFVAGVPAGVGDKLLLRLVAYRLGLRAAAALPKRALQFGSRIADSRQNARDKSGVLSGVRA